MTPSSSSVAVQDLWVEHPRGRIFVRTWIPAGLEEGHAEPAPVVLLHDSLGCVDVWREFPAALCTRTGRRVVAYDRLGFGRSDAREETLRPLEFIGDEARSCFPWIRERLGFDRFVLFGHSVGGGMAVHCAAAFPSTCEALVTESAQAFAEAQTLRGVAAAREQFRDPAQLERLARYHGAKARWVLEAWTGSWLHPDFAPWSLAEVLPQVTCPVLVLHGEKDEYGTREHARMIAGGVRGPSRLEMIPEAGHVPHREREEVVLDLVAGFLRRPTS